MVAVAIFSADPVLRRNFEQLPRDDPALVIVGMVDQPSTLRELVNRNVIDVLLVDAPTRELLAEYRAGRDRTALVVLLDGANAEDTARALSAGARAVLDRSASRNEIIAAIKAAIAGLVVVPANFVVTLLPEVPLADLLKADGAGRARLTSRELEVLAAMADGASNKMIARRLGISFHIAKFHVAAILGKLDADSRTEAVPKAAQLGLVML
jgi:two-component system, NarL family, nitrate/nitrite response regulator NarL